MRMDRRDVLAPIREVLWSLGLAGSAVVFPTFAFLMWTVTRVRREYRRAQQERALAREAEASLRKSEAHTRRIVEMALDGFIGMDAAGFITDWNAQAEQIFGWPRQEAIGRLLSDTIIPAQFREAHEQGLRHFLATGKGPMLNTRVEITGWHRDGHEIPIELAISPAMGQGGAYTFSAFVRDISARKETEQQGLMHQEELQRLNHALDRRVQARTQELAAVNDSLVAEVAERMQTEQSLEQSRQALEKLALQLLRVQEDERRRISRDLHDDINQQLALLAMDIEAVGKQFSSSQSELGQAVRAIQDRVIELSDVVRHLAYQLHPSILDDLGLPIALQRLVEDFSARSHISGSFGHKNISSAVPQEIASCLYRITQESLSNVARHAEATRVDVELTRFQSELMVTITDNGVGFDSKQPGDGLHGLGLLGMKERVALVQGNLQVMSAVGKGDDGAGGGARSGGGAMSKPRVLLADDHTLVLDGFRKLLEDRCEIVGAAEDGRMLLRMAQELQPDIITLDISMPELNGVDAARRLKKMLPHTKLIFVTMHADQAYVNEAFKAGASGYLLKRSAGTELLQAIQSVMEGQCYVTPLVAKGLVESAITGRMPAVLRE